MDKKKTKEPFYIYEIPMPIRMKLTNLLDIHDGWKKLAVEAGFGTHEILSFDKAFRRPTGSPSDDLLHEWGTKNATIRRLFEALRNINHIQEMKLLKPIVPSEYHHMIPEDDDIDQSSPNAPHKLKSFGEDNLKLPRPFDPVESSGMTPPPHSVVESSWGLANGSSVNYYNGHPSMGSHYDSKIPDKNIELHYASSCGPVPNMAAPSTVLYERKSQDMFGGIAVSSTPHFKYEDIKQATKNFSVPNKIGEGTFGAVYLANFHKTIYAVKVFNDQALHNTDQKDCRSHWKTELSTLMVYRHPNIIQLCGDSFDGPRPCLLFEYMVNGSLEDRLECKNQTPPLSWLQRVNIILGASTGINFLHTVCERPLIHGDIKSANVLLDKHFEAKIADFGLAVTANKRNDMGKYTHITKEDRKVVLATLAYLPPDFVQSRKYSIRSDVYSFGVVLFEVGSGQKAFDEKREPMDHQKLVEFASDALTSDDCLRQKLYDPHLIGCSRHLVDILFKLALTCTDESPRRRPEMGQVVDDLDSLLKQSYGQGSYGPQHQQQHLYQQQQQQLHHHLQQQQQQQQQHVQQQQQHVQQQQQHVQLQQQPHSVTLYQNLTAGGGEPASFHFSHHSSSPASASLMEANNSMIPITVPQNPSLKSDEVSSSLFTRQESVKHPSLSCLGKQQGLPTANHVSSDPEVESYQCDRKIPSADDQVLRKFNPSVFPGEKPSPMELQKMYDAERLAAEKLRQIEASDGLYENVAAMVSSTEDAKCLEWDHSKLPPEETQCQTEQVDTADHHVTPLELEKQFYEQRENLRVGHNGDVRHSEPPTCVPHPGVADGDKLLPSPQESMKAKKKLPFALEEYYEQVGQDMASLNLTDDQSLAPPPPCRPWHANESEGCLKSEECISGASTGSCESGDTCCTLTPARGSTAGESDEQQSITSITFDGDI